ncbi:hypothetical protein CWI38_1239p0020 [Hamiltosporidium tvaerminnensis]|uniref:RRM domain-containing protein n=2 Tax=Hamiltosporidium TaxID=1176354 RepID=A0A4V6MVC7_9MICR|nr:hypothetical protein CWI37_1104p0030 [Hamiltosporidium tvaerminnensis]TBU02782.1 hypothetical protein CWI36_1046p0020 [Hamiltosporidium magnivora]TBU03149.1 hypothetical protein CWI37_0347p0030 [Hamiltosporidium tvaerminnensis]TBU05823.1 hypothetical protein CWI39_0615p0010 [Hamiltosporidium magnivora]TBU10359.1 hypothetical protein CWI38_1823p0010 [Hamiltosporidium tvaerminnensis]
MNQETQFVIIKNIKPEKVYELFSTYGKILIAYIGIEENSESALVAYEKIKFAKEAIRIMDGYFCDGKYLDVKYWQYLEEYKKRQEEKRKNDYIKLKRKLGF